MRRFAIATLSVALVLASLSANVLAGPISIAHRGDSLFAPENTVAAFNSAIGKAGMVEFDVRVSADGHLVLMHDSTLDRTTDGSGSVASLTLAQLQSLDAGSWFSPAFAGERIPTLTQATSAVLTGGMTPLIERKAGGAAAYVGELLASGITNDAIVQSFDWTFLGNVHSLDPAIQLAALGSGPLSEGTLTTIQAQGADTVAWLHTNITASEVGLVHGKGMELYVWTVNSPSSIQSFINLGVDGIISDNPGLVSQLVPEPPAHTLAALAMLVLLAWKVRRLRRA